MSKISIHYLFDHDYFLLNSVSLSNRYTHHILPCREKTALLIFYRPGITQKFRNEWHETMFWLEIHNGVATLAEFTQKVPRNWIKFWVLSGLFTQQKVPRILKKCKQTRQGPELKRLPGLILVCLHFFFKSWGLSAL